MGAAKTCSTGSGTCCDLDVASGLCRAPPLSDRSRKNTFVLGVEDGSCAQIGVFLSLEHPNTLGAMLAVIGSPMFAITLDNKMHVSLVARSQPFDRASLPSDELLALGRSLPLRTEGTPDHDNLNAMIWNAPEDGGTLEVIDVGGVRSRRRATV
jgi:hypothetical protein